MAKPTADAEFIDTLQARIAELEGERADLLRDEGDEEN
jgi:hypothetical protein